jgi:CheY-like chemotaxis protein
VQLSESGEQKGTGLGLVLSKQFVDLMGGATVLESTLGKGSLFRVELPIEEASSASAAKLVQARQHQIVGVAPDQPCYRILIVEDQFENQLLLERLMTDIGLEVKLANNGEECLQVFEEWSPDLIWMDRRMPVMDGEEATRRIRQQPGGDKVKIVAVTASAFKEEHDKLIAAGMDDVVRKPFRFEEIYDSLVKHLGLRYLYKEISAGPQPTAALTPAMLAVLPVEMQCELRDAITSLDPVRIKVIIERIAEQHSELARLLSRLTAQFDYPAIIGVLDELG